MHTRPVVLLIDENSSDLEKGVETLKSILEVEGAFNVVGTNSLICALTEIRSGAKVAYAFITVNAGVHAGSGFELSCFMKDMKIPHKFICSEDSLCSDRKMPTHLSQSDFIPKSSICEVLSIMNYELEKVYHG